MGTSIAIQLIPFLVVWVLWQGLLGLSYYAILKRLDPQRARIALLILIPYVGYIILLYVHFMTLNLLTTRLTRLEEIVSTKTPQ
jgi:dolichyl-phosphate-mannose--protein O-mannosyl transferase